jgi:hypothetical protein
MKSLIRRWVQASLLAIGVAVLTQCVDGTSGPQSDYSTFGITPVWGSNASHALGVLDEGGFPLDRVRIILIRPVSDTLKDTTVTMHRSDPGIELPLTVRVVPGIRLNAILQFKSGDVLLYEGRAEVETVPLNRFPIPVQLPLEYLGPGKDAVRVSVTPATGSFATGANVNFTATAFDAADVAQPGTPFEWTVSDETMGAFTSGGVFAPSGKGGSVTVTATTPTGIAGSATVTLVPPGTVAASVTVVSGNAQSDTVLKTLANPFVVKVADAAGTPVPGVTVTWTRTTGFGTPANATSTSDAAGLASLSYRLGDLSGTETVQASVAGVPTPATFTATAIPGQFIFPVVTGFAYLRVTPSPASPRVGDTLTMTADSISASGAATPVTAQWASSNPGRGSIDANGRLIVADTGEIIITATRNGMIGHSRVTVLPAPMLTAFNFSPKTLAGITNTALTTSFTFAAFDAGSGVTSATVTLTGPNAETKTCAFSTPTTGTKYSGVFDCPLTLPAGTATGTWHVTSLTINGSITRTYGESVLALFSSTTLTINP